MHTLLIQRVIQNNDVRARSKYKIVSQQMHSFKYNSYKVVDIKKVEHLKTCPSITCSKKNIGTPVKWYVLSYIWGKRKIKDGLFGNSSCVKVACLLMLIHVETDELPYKNHPHHCVLIIELNDNDGGVVSQFSGLSKQLHVLKDQQLVPSRAQSLSQHLGGDEWRRRWAPTHTWHNTAAEFPIL